jgi:hypothetical protein
MSWTKTEIHDLLIRQKAFFQTGKTLSIPFRMEMLRKLREAEIQIAGGIYLQHRVSEKFERLVIADPVHLLLIVKRGMCQRLKKQLRILKRVSDDLLQTA